MADVNRVYKHKGIRFEAAWFPIFYMLAEQETLSIKAISAELEISHSATSQMVSKLQEKGLIRLVSDKTDGRKKAVSLTAKGIKLLHQVQPVWKSLQLAMDELLEQLPNGDLLMPAIAAIEKSFQQHSILNRIEKHLP